jgi:hypothetical protein
MNRKQQVDFVLELTATIAGNTIDEINAGKIPATWDGFELRQLLADRFANATANMDKERKADYCNTCLVNNL